MIVVYSDRFYKHLDKIIDTTVLNRAENAIEKFKSANTLRDIPNIKPMEGYAGFYRHRFGDWRIGFSLETDDSIILLKIGHRSEFYKYFPKNYA